MEITEKSSSLITNYFPSLNAEKKQNKNMQMDTDCQPQQNELNFWKFHSNNT